MRKLLLASAATLGALLATTNGAKAQPVKPVAPGTVVVHLNGYLQFELGAFGSTFNTVKSAGEEVVTPEFGKPNEETLVGAGVYKLNPLTTDGDARIYPGFDAETTTGVAYGAQIELRTQASDAGVAAGKVSGAGSAAGTEGIYIKRAYGYVGTEDGGFIRLGQGDSAFTLLQSGDVEAFGDGAQFNTDGGLASLLPTGATPGNFIYADASGLYATGKVVYISPKIAGFSVAAGYEPNSNGIKEGYGDCANAGTISSTTSTSPSTVCADESSSPLSSDIGKRRKNTVDAAVQYAVESNGLVVKASGGVLYGAPINYTGATALKAAPHGYDNLEVYEAGAQATFAGLTLGADVKGGQVEDSFAFKPKGARDGFTYIVGADYTMGPFVLGGSFYDGQTSGAFVPGGKVARTLNEYGAAAGGNFVISKNLSLFLQYLYGHKQQYGNTAFLNDHDAQVQAIGLGGTFKW
jgi:hypothetical protein